MAAKVNKKFVFGLAGGLVAVFVGIAGLYMFIQVRSGARNARLGDEAMAKGDYKAADSLYSRAVGREQTNLEWLKKWRAAREKKVPDTETQHRDDYAMYNRILRQTATVQRTDVDAHRVYLNQLLEERLDGASPEAWQQMYDEAQTALAFFTGEQPVALRRFRGIAGAMVWATNNKLEPAARDSIRQDLEAAVKADPKDLMSASQLALWHRVAAQRARESGNTAEEQANLKIATRVMADLGKADPTSPDVAVAVIRSELIDAATEGLANRDPASIAELRRTQTERFRPRIAEVAARLKQADPKQISRTAVAQFMAMAPELDPKDGPKMAVEIIDRALSASPSDAMLQTYRAEMLARSGDSAAAQAQLDALVGLPNLPVGLDGLRLFTLRNRARFQMANLAVTKAIQGKSGPDAAKLLDTAREARKKLADAVPATSAQLTLIDAKLAVASGEISQAQELFARYERAPGDASDQLTDALLLMSQLQAQTGAPGEARRLLMRVQEMRPGNTEVLLAIAKLDASMNNREAAVRSLKAVLDLDPDNAEAKRLMPIVAQDEASITDPVIRTLVQAERVRVGEPGKPGDDRKASEIIEKALEPSKFDKRLLDAALRLRLARQDNAGAIDLVRKALALTPDDAELKSAIDRLSSAGDVDKELGEIAAADAPPIEKALARFSRLESAGRKDEARAALAEAAKIAPDNKRVVELRFIDALGQGKMEEAQALMERAVAINADGAQGDTFKARISIAKGDLREGASLLQRAVDRGNAPLTVHRVLGSVLQQMGRMPEAIRSFKTAWDMNPTDLLSLKNYMAALVTANQREEALTLARQQEKAASGDPEFADLWLSLEAENGNAALARDRREDLLKRSPSNLRNVAALADIYMRANAWDKAKALIDRLQKDQPGLSTVGLLARWHADQGDLGVAAGVYSTYIKELKDKNELKTPEPQLAFAQFLLDRGQVMPAIATMREAAKLQDPKVRRVDQMLGDIQLSRGMFTDAEKTFRDLLEGGLPDPDRALRKRLIESLVQQGSWAAGEKEIATLGEYADQDLEVLMQRSHVAMGQGDRRKAREMLDKAVARFPDQPQPYVRRARLLATSRDSQRDALEDLGTAIRLDPGMWQALRARAQLNFATDRVAEGLADMRVAVEKNPGFDALRFELINAMLDHNQDGDAMTIAEAPLATRPTDLNYLNSCGIIFAERGLWQRAARFYKVVWQQSPLLGIGAYTNALLNQSPPNLSEAETMLRTTPIKVDGNADMLMARATIRRKQKRDADAAADVRASLAALPDREPVRLRQWYARFRSITPEVSAAAAVLKDVRVAGPLDEWLNAWRAIIASEAPETRNTAIAQLRAMTENPSTAPAVREEAYRAWTTAVVAAKDWTALEEVCRKALATLPDDAVLNNNMAYVLAEHLGRAPEAVAFAEKAAAKSNEVDGVILDTLASVLYKAGQKDKGVARLEQAIRSTASPTARAAYLIKLARWYIEMGNKPQALTALFAVQDLRIESPAVRAEKTKEIDDLTREIEGR